MVLSIGTMLGPYENAGAIGAGRMGNVYHVCDARNDPSFAIKTLPFHVSAHRAAPIAVGDEMKQS
jgi:hypothetical protein